MKFAIPPRSSITTAQHRAWLRDAIPDHANRRLALAALAAFDRISEAGAVKNSDMSAIARAASSRFKPVWVIGTDILVRVATKYREGQNAIRHILMHGPANARFQVTDSITSELPKQFTGEIIRMAFRDKGSKVRDKAVEICSHLRLKEMVPELKDMLVKEQNRTVRETLEFSIAMLQEGYLLKYRDRQPILWVRGPLGYCAPALTQEEIDEGKMPALIERIQKGLFP
jgi:hypothetical protein